MKPWVGPIYMGVVRKQSNSSALLTIFKWNRPVSGGFPSLRTGDVEKVSMSRHHHIKADFFNSVNLIRACVDIKHDQCRDNVLFKLNLNAELPIWPRNSSTHWSPRRREHILTMTYRNELSCMKMFEFRVNFKLRFFPNSPIKNKWVFASGDDWVPCRWQTIIPTIVEQVPWRHMGSLGLNVCVRCTPYHGVRSVIPQDLPN